MRFNALDVTPKPLDKIVHLHVPPHPRRETQEGRLAVVALRHPNGLHTGFRAGTGSSPDSVAMMLKSWFPIMYLLVSIMQTVLNSEVPYDASTIKMILQSSEVLT